MMHESPSCVFARLSKLLALGAMQPTIFGMHPSLSATLASFAKFLADDTVHPFTTAMHSALTVATESKLSASGSRQPMISYVQLSSSVLASEA